MREKKYEVIFEECKLAGDMNLRTALMLIEACCDKYYNEHISITIREQADE